MKTHKLPDSISFGQAAQEIFLRTGESMFPRQVSMNGPWLYDTAEPANLADMLKAKPLFSEQEIQTIHLVCCLHYRSHEMWHELAKVIGQFNNQKRFYRATYLQPHILASAFYLFTMLKLSKN